MKFNKKILISFFIFLDILFISFSIIIANKANNHSDSNKNNEKMNFQIKYLSEQLIEMSYILNHNAMINWQNLQSDTQTLYLYWNSSILDFNTLEIDKNILTEFGINIDNLSIAIKNNNQQETIRVIVYLYKTLTILSENINYNHESDLMKSKYYLLAAYSIAEKGNWTVTQENILKSDEQLSRIVNNMENTDYNQYNLNQAYVAVKELENTIITKNLELFYWKYTITMDKLNNL